MIWTGFLLMAAAEDSRRRKRKRELSGEALDTGSHLTKIS